MIRKFSNNAVFDWDYKTYKPFFLVDTDNILMATKHVTFFEKMTQEFETLFDYTVNNVIADKNVITNVMNKYPGLQRIELNGFAKRHWKNGYYPFEYGWCSGLC